MPSILNNVSTADAYTDPATCTFLSPSRKVNVTITNAAVYAQWGRVGANGQPDGTYTDEEFLIPGQWSKIDPGSKYGLAEVASVRFRSAVAGKPAQVSANGA